MFLWDWFCRKLGLTDLPSHDGKVTSDINFILGPYYRSFRADRDSLYEWLLHSRLLWKKAWNNEYQSEYESVSRISIWINFHLSHMFFKIGVFKALANFIGKHQCWSIFLIKLQAWRPATLLKRDSNTGVLLWNFRNF